MARMQQLITGQRKPLPQTAKFGSWLLGSAEEIQPRAPAYTRRLIVVFVTLADLIGVAVFWLIVVVAVPEPNVFTRAPAWLTFGVTPTYLVVALFIGTIWIKRELAAAVDWSIEGRTPTRTDQRNTFRAPWHLARIHLLLWGIGAALLTTLFGLADPNFIPKVLFSIGLTGIVAATNCYLITEFAL